MRKVSEYEAHAAECRRLADQMSNPEHQTRLIKMAERWEMLAIARVKQLSRKKSKGVFFPRALVPSASLVVPVCLPRRSVLLYSATPHTVSPSRR